MIIGRLKGIVAAIGPDSVMVDVAGVGYVALAGSRVLSRLTAGDPAELHIETRVTESSITLYAFESDQARAWFVRLQDVPGVAGKSAMAILDVLGTQELMDAIALKDHAAIARAKGVGKKLAERIIGELSGKPPPLGRFTPLGTHVGSSETSAPVADTADSARADATSALVNLGYGQSEAARAVATAARASGDDPRADQLIRLALKELAQ